MIQIHSTAIPRFIMAENCTLHILHLKKKKITLLSRLRWWSWIQGSVVPTRLSQGFNVPYILLQDSRLYMLWRGFLYVKTDRVAKGSSREKVLHGRRSDVVSSTVSTREHNWSHFHTNSVPIAISTHFPLYLSHFGLIIKGVRPPLRLLHDRFRNVLRF